MYGWDDIERNRTFRGIQRVRTLSTLVVTGRKAMQMFCSIAGLGKTETVLEVFAEHNLKPHYSSPTNATEFAYDLWQHKDSPYFLDDCDRIARSEPCANIGKMCWGPQRLVVVPGSLRIQKNEERRREGSDKYDPNIPPPTFSVGRQHGVIWNSNKDFTNPATIKAEMAADFAALVSRGFDPYLIQSDPQSVFDYTVWMILDGMLRRHPQGDFANNRGGFKLAVQQEVLDFICTYGRRLKEITPRMAWKLACARRDDPDWEEAWQDQLTPHALWNGLILPDEPPRLLSPAMRRAMEPPKTDPDPPPVEPPPPPAASEPKPEPDPPVANPPVPLLPAPDPAPEPLTLGRAVNAVYTLPVDPEPPQPAAGKPAPSEPVPDPIEPSRLKPVRSESDPAPAIREPEPPGPSQSDLIDGYEALDDNKCVEYFGIPATAPPHLVPCVLTVRSVLEEKVGTRDIGEWIKAGYAATRNNQTLFNIAKIREVLDFATAQVAQAEADGFKIAEPTEYGAQNHGEAHDLMLKALGLQRVVDGLMPLVDGGYLRIIGGLRLYQIEKMHALMEKGRAAQKSPNPVAHDPIDPPRPVPRKQIIRTVTLAQNEKDIIKNRWELKGLAGRVDPQRRTLALDNRYRTYHLIEMTDDDDFMDEAHKTLRDQGLRFWEQVGDHTIETALEIVKKSE